MTLCYYAACNSFSIHYNLKIISVITIKFCRRIQLHKCDRLKDHLIYISKHTHDEEPVVSDYSYPIEFHRIESADNLLLSNYSH